MKIAVIGGGISGNTCVWLLHRQHNVTLFEANDYVGGHTNTIDIQAYGRSLTIDTGFMVYNERTYPHFTRLLGELKIDSQDSDMSFSVSCERTSWEYQVSSLSVGPMADKHERDQGIHFSAVRETRCISEKKKKTTHGQAASGLWKT